ncbi:glycoside hydrolase family 31, putative [Babesia ovis]|uniref:Glycoside hydrolase family 31, putative n=1 Tax=Babesia ovis TaxID=5869 RepID=A0A9W5TAD0_BABOV|nr:glycoside hydrolase family 31, putative [Babesia ovis]
MDNRENTKSGSEPGNHSKMLRDIVTNFCCALLEIYGTFFVADKISTFLLKSIDDDKMLDRPINECFFNSSLMQTMAYLKNGGVQLNWGTSLCLMKPYFANPYSTVALEGALSLLSALVKSICIHQSGREIAIPGSDGLTPIPAKVKTPAFNAS